jgi:hypothetical protein
MSRRFSPHFLLLLFPAILWASGTPSPTFSPTPASALSPQPTPTPDPSTAFWEDYRDVLKNHVDARGLVDYEGLKADRAKLDHVVEAVAMMDPQAFDAWRTKDKIAFYLNAYNALILQTIVDHYPVKPSGPFGNGKTGGIKDIPGALSRAQHQVLGQRMTLDHIEHEILRRQFDEPRVLFALVPACRGGAVLRGEPYEGSRLDEEMGEQARRFLADPANFKVDGARKVVSLSPIFSWYGVDFIAKYGPQSPFKGYSQKVSADLHFIGKHLSAAERKTLSKGKYKVEYLGFDWSLNERTEKPVRNEQWRDQ